MSETSCSITRIWSLVYSCKEILTYFEMHSQTPTQPNLTVLESNLGLLDACLIGLPIILPAGFAAFGAPARPFALFCQAFLLCLRRALSPPISAVKMKLDNFLRRHLDSDTVWSSGLAVCRACLTICCRGAWNPPHSLCRVRLRLWAQFTFFLYWVIVQ